MSISKRNYHYEAPTKPIEKQDKPIITDDDFETKVKGIIDDNKNIENNKQSDNQQYYISSSFKLISKRSK
jgi:hypothetical protein